MSIVSSIFELESHSQIDGRTWVKETHTDNVGLTHVVRYLADLGTNYSAIMAARAIVIAAQLLDEEVSRILSIDAPPVFVYASNSDLISAFRAAYRDASKIEAARLATWLLNRIDDGTYTTAQVENAFGITDAQWTNTILPKLSGYRTAYQAVLAAQGQ